MKKIKIINKIICKALDNGWLKGRDNLLDFALADADDNYWFFWKDNTHDVFSSLEEIFFSFEFAKAFFGEKRVFCVSSYGCLENEDDDNDDPKFDGKSIYDLSIYRRIEAWKYHLQEMVLLNDEERIKYLEEFL